MNASAGAERWRMFLHTTMLRPVSANTHRIHRRRTTGNATKLHIGFVCCWQPFSIVYLSNKKGIKEMPIELFKIAKVNLKFILAGDCMWVRWRRTCVVYLLPVVVVVGIASGEFVCNQLTKCECCWWHLTCECEYQKPTGTHASRE